MSILIKNMAMPKNCEECYFDAGGYCLAKSLNFLDWCEVNDRPRPSWCPITEVPPHGRLIDADALVDELIKRSRTNPMPLLGQMVDFAPTIIEAEVKT